MEPLANRNVAIRRSPRFLCLRLLMACAWCRIVYWRLIFISLLLVIVGLLMPYQMGAATYIGARTFPFAFIAAMGALNGTKGFASIHRPGLHFLGDQLCIEHVESARGSNVLTRFLVRDGRREAGQ